MLIVFFLFWFSFLGLLLVFTSILLLTMHACSLFTATGCTNMAIAVRGCVTASSCASWKTTTSTRRSSAKNCDAYRTMSNRGQLILSACTYCEYRNCRGSSSQYLLCKSAGSDHIMLLHHSFETGVKIISRNCTE